VGYFQQDALRRHQLIFRGQSNSSYHLRTTLDRWRSFASDIERESCVARLLDEFRRELSHLELGSLSELSGDAFELLARHQGLPSPLMDWTRSPYVAAYFAFEGALPAKAPYVAIWEIDRARLPELSDFIDIIEDHRLIEFNRRARRQHGVLLRVLTVTRPLEELLGSALTKYEIPSSEAAWALGELDEMGLSATNLFSDMEAAARTAQFRVSIGG